MSFYQLLLVKNRFMHTGLLSHYSQNMNLQLWSIYLCRIEEFDPLAADNIGEIFMKQTLKSSADDDTLILC